MSSQETPILNVDGIKEEKIKLSAARVGCLQIFLILLWFLIALGVTVFLFLCVSVIGFLFSGGLFVAGLYYICCMNYGSEVTINKKDNILKFQRIKCCCCCREAPRLFDLNQIQKINIFSLGEIYGYRMESKGQNYRCFIIYKNGTLDDISYYFTGFNGFSVVSIADFENMLRKYLPVDNTIPPNFQQEVQSYIPNIPPVNNNNMVPGYIPNIPSVNNNNMANGYNSGMTQGTPQNYNQQGYNTNCNINVNNNNTNQYSNTEPILPTEDEVNKPGTGNDNYGAPSLPQ